MATPTPAQKRKILAEEYDPAPTLPPTPAQIEAAAKALAKMWFAGIDDNPAYEILAKAALTAAAEAGPKPHRAHEQEFQNMKKEIDRLRDMLMKIEKDDWVWLGGKRVRGCYGILANAARVGKLTTSDLIRDPVATLDDAAHMTTPQQAVMEEAAQTGEAPTDKMMIEHLNDQIQTLLCENEQLKAATQVGEQEITGLKAMLVDAGAKIERMKEMLSASERLRDHAEKELGKENELVKQLRKDVEINATIEHCAQRLEQLISKGQAGEFGKLVLQDAADELRKLKEQS